MPSSVRTVLTFFDDIETDEPKITSHFTIKKYGSHKFLFKSNCVRPVLPKNQLSCSQPTNIVRVGQQGIYGTLNHQLEICWPILDWILLNNFIAINLTFSFHELWIINWRWTQWITIIRLKLFLGNNVDNPVKGDICSDGCEAIMGYHQSFWTHQPRSHFV